MLGWRQGLGMGLSFSRKLAHGASPKTEWLCLPGNPALGLCVQSSSQQVTPYLPVSWSIPIHRPCCEGEEPLSDGQHQEQMLGLCCYCYLVSLGLFVCLF